MLFVSPCKTNIQIITHKNHKFSNIFTLVNTKVKLLKKIAKNLKDRIVDVPEVLSATINGDREEVIEINVSQKVLDVYHINFDDIVNTFNEII